MELIERPDMRAVHYLHSIPYATFKKDVIDEEIAKGKSKPADKDIRVWFDNLQSFCKTNIKTKGHTKRIYAYSMNTPAGLGGRLFCGNSMQGIWGRYRGLLMRGRGTDIDMKNAHPTILAYVCRKHGIHHPQLAYYNANREECLAKFPSKAIGKNAYLVATNNDKVSRRANLPAQFRAYDKEMKVIQSQLITKPEYTALIETVPEYKKTKNYNGSVINRILCYYENIAINHCLHVLNARALEVAIFMCDGCMPYGDHYENADLLSEIEEYVESQIPGLAMKWDYKDHDMTLSIPEDFDENNYADDTKMRFVADDNAAANLIFAEVKDLIMPTARNRIFLKVGNIWKCDREAIDTFLLNYIMESNICKTNDESKYVPYAQNVKTAKNIRESVLEKIRGQKDIADIYSKFHTTTRGRLCFRDGVLDMRAKRFVYWADIDFEYYSTMMIPYDFGKYFNNPDLETIAKVKKDIYETMFGDKTDTALHFLSRGIAGEIGDKNWATYLGNRDCGKGVLFDSVKGAFGEYVHTFELSHLLYERAAGTDEVSRKMYWAIELEFARIAISQETPCDDRLKFNGAMMKKLAGGGDEIVARRNFDTHDTHFVLDTTFLIMGNNALRPDKPDCLEHCVEFSSVYQFKTQEEIDAMKAANEDELIWGIYRKKDDGIKERCYTDAWKLATVYLMCENYNANAVSIKRVIEDEGELSIRRRILLHYEITRDDKDYIAVKDLRNTINDCKKKINNEMSSMGIDKQRIQDTKIKFDKICYIGIKLRDDVLIEES